MASALSLTGRVEPEDISNAVLFLVSGESRYIAGVQLPADGGSPLAGLPGSRPAWPRWPRSRTA